MIVAMTGSSGLIGTALRARLAERGDRCLRLVRGAAAADGAAPATAAGRASTIPWNPDAGSLDASRLEGVDAVVHLAGATIGRWPWTAAHKERVMSSRARGTALLASALARMARPPRVLVSTSAIGYYGSRGDETLREDSPPGSGFLAEVCREWEAATEPATSAGIRVVRVRTGLVLSGNGGLLAAMRLPFSLGLGGVVGNGRQWMSWIAIDDLVRVYERALDQDALSGPVNAVAPNPVTNAEFTKTLARVLRRPAIAPLPIFAARILLGREMADELLLASARVEPARLLRAGFAFRHATLEGGLRTLLTPAGAACPGGGGAPS
jgi:uncharacterized protein (TIGR01777 family)